MFSPQNGLSGAVVLNWVRCTPYGASKDVQGEQDLIHPTTQKV